ncbi:hypothetical protein D9M72_567690 [compost metagenome]
MRVSNGMSLPQWPRQTSVAKSRTALTQPATISAVAMPLAPSRGNRVSASETFTTTEMAAKIIGVRVSSRAKKPGMKALIKTKAGRPRP